MGFQRSVRINARTYDQQPITVSTDIRKSPGDFEPLTWLRDPHFIIKYLPRGEGNEDRKEMLADAVALCKFPCRSLWELSPLLYLRERRPEPVFQA